MIGNEAIQESSSGGWWIAGISILVAILVLAGLLVLRHRRSRDV